MLESCSVQTLLTLPQVPVHPLFFHLTYVLYKGELVRFCWSKIKVTVQKFWRTDLLISEECGDWGELH